MAGALLVLPLLLSLANALRVRNCNFAAGLGVLRAAAGRDGALRGARGRAGRGRSRGAARLVAFALPVLSLLWTLLRLYRDPPVFAFDPFGGYFPGPIYDEALRPPADAGWFPAREPGLDRDRGGDRARRGRARLRTRAAGAAGPLAAAAPLVAASLVLYAMGGSFRFRITRADLGARSIGR